MTPHAKRDVATVYKKREPDDEIRGECYSKADHAHWNSMQVLQAIRAQYQTYLKYAKIYDMHLGYDVQRKN